MQTQTVNVYVLEPEGKLTACLQSNFSAQIALFSFNNEADLLSSFDRNAIPTAEIVILDAALSESEIDTIHALKRRPTNTEIIVLTDSRDHHAVLKTLREEVHQTVGFLIFAPFIIH